jgi:thiamine-phosphate pyrophosphorylase
VIEDFARFGRDDRAAAEAAKQLRHDLRRIADSLGVQRLLRALDVGGDVGRSAKTAAELDRATADDVVRAAFARLTESARSLSEYGKLASCDTGMLAERLRYRAYALEQQVVLRGALLARFRAVRLYVIITQTLCRGDWLKTAEAAIEGGAACIQLREKGLADRELLRRAHALRELTASRDALLIVNDRADLARLAGADGVHIGQDDLSVAQARSVGGGRLLVGKSTHTPQQLEAALAEQPDYIAVGPMFPTATKPQDFIAGPEALRAAAQRTSIALVAIGGITARNVQQVVARGAGCVAVCSAVIGAEEPAAASRAIRDPIGSHLV